MKNSRKNVLLLGFMTVVLWSIAFPMSKVAMNHYDPFSLGFLRVLVASITLLIIGKKVGIRLPKRNDIVLFILSGACGFGIYLFAFNKGIQTLTSASSSIVIALTPVMTAIAANFIYGEKLTKIGWITIATAFLGVVTMTLWDGVLSINTGILWTLGAAVVFCFYNLLNRKLSNMGYTGIEIVTYSMISSVFILSPFMKSSIAEVSTAGGYDIFVLLLLGILSSAIAYYLWSQALTMAENTSDVTNFGFLTPFLATLLGGIILGELPNLGTVIGGLIIISSIIIFSKLGKVN